MTTETTMIGGVIAATTIEASVPARMVMKSTQLRSQVVAAITRMTTTSPKGSLLASSQIQSHHEELLLPQEHLHQAARRQ
jgi:hypothetical protein